MAEKSFLDSIRSPLPCSKDWNEMTGDAERVRFCESCAKDVYNLSAMTRREARRFVAQNAGRVCVRYVRLSDGTIETAGTRFYNITRRASVAAGVLGAALTLSQIAGAQTPETPKKAPDKTSKSQKKTAPATSRISFTVCDPNNERVPNAEVKLIDQKTREEFTVRTGDHGAAYFDLLAPGRYDVKISAEGFISGSRVVVIREKIEPNIEVHLDVGTFTGVVDVDWYEIPLFQAIAQEDNETVKDLIGEGFKITTRDESGNTPLHVAVEHENLEIVEFLLARGADANAKNKRKLTPVLLLEDFDEEIAVKILRLLIARGADLNLFDDENETLLMTACEDDNLEVVRILLEAGANPNLKDEDGETAFDKTDSEEIKRLLKQYGAKER